MQGNPIRDVALAYTDEWQMESSTKQSEAGAHLRGVQHPLTAAGRGNNLHFSGV
jgi:hypothetical protein